MKLCMLPAIYKNWMQKYFSSHYVDKYLYDALKVNLQVLDKYAILDQK